MPGSRRMLVDVGMRDLPFPMMVASKLSDQGQATVANVSVRARIMHEFEANWIHTFIQVLHQHRDKIGTRTLQDNIADYLDELNALAVTVDFSYPFFIEKTTPVSNQKCLVRYLCTFSAKASSVIDVPKITFKIEVPAITTDPSSSPEQEGGLFGQLSVVTLEVDSRREVYPEDLVELVDAKALSPVYSFLTPEDREYIIRRVHSEEKTSVVLTDEIKSELAKDDYVQWFAVRTSNFGMMHSYSTLVATEKGGWVPETEMTEEESL